MKPYTSFLICFHGDITNVYQEGLPLGVIRDGKFEVHKHTMPNGDKIPVELDFVLLAKVSSVVDLIE